MGDLQERFFINLLGFQGPLLGLQPLLPLSEFPQTRTQFVQLQEILLVGVYQLLAAPLQAQQFLADQVAAPAG